MRILLALVFCVSAFAQLTIDHVTICGTHLAQMQKAFGSATGITPEYGGRHANHATEMDVVSFPDGAYLELMAIEDNADPQAVAAHVWTKFLRANSGPCAFAIRTPDRVAQLLNVKPPVRSGRMRPDGVSLEWETSDIGDKLRGTFFPFLIRDLTPLRNRVYPSGKPTTKQWGGVSKIVIVVHNLSDAIAQYNRTFNLPRPVGQHDVWSKADLAWFEGTQIVLAQPTGDSWMAQRLSKFGEGPCALVLHTDQQVAGSETSRWYGHPVSWLNSAKLGWHLGFE
jgi:hypothetical protein